MGDDEQGLRDDNAIAIVGMACSFPDAESPAEFWRNLAAGRESVVDYDEAALRAAGVPEALLASPDYVRAGVPLAGFDGFDAGFFGLSPAEAKVMDPQHRRFLECAWAALEDAGHTPRSAGGNIGVFAGSGMHWYMLRNLMANPALVDELGEFQVRHTANDKDFLATRVSYHLDLRGPSINIQTACSTSLVAVHMACQSLLNGESDLALAGGATIEVPHGVGYLYREEEVRSRDGRCRPMDAQAGGTVFGSGCGVVVLRRLADALADGDTIHAVIRGSAINNDGAGKAGYLAPSVDGQAQAIAEALAVADIDPATIGYVEAHGTGTRIGDPIEVAALTQAFGATPRRQYCALGSVKSNIGHLDTAAGVAGLIKIALALRHGQLPPSLNYHAPNPEIDFGASPFYVNTTLSDWPVLGAPRRAGISSLGVGGTNAHVVLEEAPPVPVSSTAGTDTAYVLPLSAKSPAALADVAARLRAHLEAEPGQALADVAWTLRHGRVALPHRLAVAGRERAELIAKLQAPPRPVRAADEPPGVVFMFPGQGAQYPGMARRLLATDAPFRAAMDACFAVLHALGRDDVRAALYPERAGPDAAAALRATEVTQPALFCVEYALAMSLRAKGLRPVAMIGHSLGEYVAACLAGIFGLEAALRLVCRRGELVASLSPGAMLAVAAAPAALAPYLSPRVVIAGANAPELCVCSGDIADIDALATRLEAQGIGARRLETSHAFHSPMLDPILPAFRAAVAEAAPAKVADARIVSNVSGRWLTAEEGASPDYWVRQLRQRVDFVGGLEQLQALGPRVLLEVGPGHALSGFARAHAADARTVATLPHPKDDTADDVVFAAAAGALWAHGVAPDWAAWGQPAGRRVPLPTYPFQRQRHWVDAAPVAAPSAAAPRAVPDVDDTGRRPFEEWCYVTDWQTIPPVRGRPPSRVLLFGGTWGVGQALAARLRERGVPLLCVEIGNAYAATAERIVIDPASEEDWDRLADTAGAFSHIAYLWPVDTAMASVAKITAGCFDHLLRLARRIERLASPDGLHLVAATANAHQVGGETGGNPHHALAAGPLRTIPRECPGCRATWVDLDAAQVERSVAEAATHLLAELEGDASEDTVAWRNRRRLRPVPTRSRLDAGAASALKPGGRYVITGAFGGAGQALACHLASRYRAHLVLVARTALPPSSEREAWLAASKPGDPVRHRLQVVRRLEALGAKVDVVAADVADGWVLARAIADLGVAKLDGVFHAAGVLDDAPLATKTIEGAHRVLHPKVAGALGLQSLLQFAPDFMLYFSSLSAQAGIAGQVDYTAANAFLSAFADVADAQSATTRHVAVEWSIWRDAGMAAMLAARAGLAPVPPVDADLTDHPVLSWVSRGGDGVVTYSGMVSAEAVWFLDQHRLGATGEAILPGTAYIELIATALQMARGRFVPLRISGMTLSAPLLLRPRDKRLLRVELVPDGADGHRIVVSSQGADPDDLLEHAVATVAALPPGQAEAGETLPAAVVSRVVDGPYAHPALVFGPRWDCVTRLEVGECDAALQLDLRTPEDLAAHPFHPALLDMAVGAAQQELAPALRGQLVPFRYGAIALLAPLTRALDSRVRARVSEDRLVLDVDIRAPDGTLLAVFRDFVLARMRAGRVVGTTAPPRRRGRVNPILDVGFADGLSNQEALAVLEAVLAGRGPAQVTIAARDAAALVRDMRHACEADAEPRADAAFPERPDLGVPFAAPAPGLQQAIAALWEAMLEVRGIGAHDNFFELGGHSLLLTRLVSRLKRDQGVALPIDQAIEEPTIARWSALAAQARPAMAVPKVDRNRYRVTE